MRREPVSGNALPDKLFFKIGEVAQIVGVRAHVLRYWESEFAALRPLKTRGSHRIYRRRDVELAVLLRRLLHEEGLTIAGAKRRLRELGHQRVTQPTAPSVAREMDVRAELLAMREELSRLLVGLQNIIDDGEDSTGTRPKQELTDHGEGTASKNVPIRSMRRPAD